MVIYLTLEEVEGVLNVSETLRDTILLRILYWGFRVSEVVGDEKTGIPGIYYPDIDFEAGEIKVKQKGKKDLTRIIDRETLSMIKLYCKEKRIKRGQILPMHRTTAWRILKRLAKKADLARAEEISCHPWGRHTFAIHALNRYHKYMGKSQRFNIALVAKQLGHADITTTIRFYTPFVTSDMKEAAFGIV